MMFLSYDSYSELAVISDSDTVYRYGDVSPYAANKIKKLISVAAYGRAWQMLGCFRRL